MKVFIDTNVFIIHLRYKRDRNYKANKLFLDLVINNEIAGYTSIYNLLETVGILSFNLNKSQIKDLFINFPNIFNVTVLFPDDIDDSILCIDIDRVLRFIYKKMSFMDAVILDMYQMSDTSFFTTWNAKGFKSKTNKEVLTPEEFLKIYEEKEKLK